VFLGPCCSLASLLRFAFYYSRPTHSHYTPTQLQDDARKPSTLAGASFLCQPSHSPHPRKPAAPAPSPQSTTMSSFFESWKPFDVNKVKPYLKMAVQRIQIATNKKTAAVKYVMGKADLAGGKGKAHL